LPLHTPAAENAIGFLIVVACAISAYEVAHSFLPHIRPGPILNERHRPEALSG
jgi:hypothetical protein